ncbi:dephospho-CoA kinase-domain-containing protein [Pyronema omphalodes]|nr:dephospho-CoA kinase-domain-containing protein [Pyronema omphalodes]
MFILGLTGSIATGKSTASSLLSSQHSLPIIDADLLARAVVNPGTPGHAAIVRHFLPSTPNLLAADGSLDRAVLGRRVFGNSPERIADRKVLNGIIHPLVRKEMMKGILKAWLAGAWAVVLDVPLLFEAGMESVCGGVMVVGVGKEEQLRRLMNRDSGLTQDEAARRVESQWGWEEKAELGRKIFGDKCWVVDNSGSKEELAERLKGVVTEMKKGRDGGWRYVWGAPPVAVVLAVWTVVRNWWRRRNWELKKKQAKGDVKGKAKL